MYQLYGHQNSSAAAIEAALELCEIPYRFIDVESFAGRPRVGEAQPAQADSRPCNCPTAASSPKARRS
jgi:hypothetical protein